MDWYESSGSEDVGILGILFNLYEVIDEPYRFQMDKKTCLGWQLSGISSTF